MRMGHGQSRAAFYSRSHISPFLIVILLRSAGLAPHDIRRGDAISKTVLSERPGRGTRLPLPRGFATVPAGGPQAATRDAVKTVSSRQIA